jgi:hypothetical protein
MLKKLLLLLACLSPLAAQALPVPEGAAAVADAVIGKVRVDQGKGYQKLTVGQALVPGSMIKTGTNGRVALSLPGGSTARIASNTEFKLKEEKVRKGVFTRLFKGTVRFLVAKQTADSSFETELPNAVAAVKGTEPEYGSDGKQSTVKVFSSHNPIALILSDPSTGKETSLKAGEKLVYDGGEFKLEQVDQQDRAESEKQFEGLPDPVKEGEGGGEPAAEGTPAPTPVVGGDSGSGSDSGSGDSDQALEDATDEALAEAMDELYLDGFLERDERTGDIMAGKIVYDRFGERVQVSHLITRADDSTVAIASYSLRDGGPNKGVTAAIESATFNKPLPSNWGEVWSRPLNDAANLDFEGYPVYYRTSQSFLALNPAGDNIFIDTVFGAPVWDYGTGGGMYDPAALGQPRSQDLYVQGMLALSYSLESSPDGDPRGSYSWNVNSYAGQGWYTSTQQVEGGWRFNLTDYYGAPLLSQDLHFLDDNGNVLAHPGFAQIIPSASEPSPNAQPNVFKGFDANVELAFTSPLFEGRSIDLIFLPGFYDLYQMLELPSDYHYYGAP